MLERTENTRHSDARMGSRTVLAQFYGGNLGIL